MKLQTMCAVAVAAGLGPLACGDPRASEVEAHAPLPLGAAAGQTFKIGVLVDNASPAKNNLTAAATLAATQLNQGLAAAGSNHRFAVLVTPYDQGEEQDETIDLVNNQGVLAMVTDGSFTTGNVNLLNHELVPRIDHEFPVTCYQCSSPRLNDLGDIHLGFSDPEGWLLRTYFNASFENEAQARVIAARPNGGDFNHDGHLKVVIYFDVDRQSLAFTFPAALDAVHPGSHSVEQVFKTNPSDPASRTAQMAEIFDTAPDGHAPDLVYLLVGPDKIAEALGDYSSFPVSPRAPAQVNDELRRDYLLPALLANGGASLQGTSMLRVSSTPSGALFRNAFVSATGVQPESTAAFLYDAIVLHAGAIGWAFHFGSLDPAVILGNTFNVNDPTGKTIRPKVADFKTAVQRIGQEQPINYDGAGSSVDLDGIGESFPPIVHWKIQGGKFVELEKYDCNPGNSPAICRRL
jgi:hypothetical protein